MQTISLGDSADAVRDKLREEMEDTKNERATIGELFGQIHRKGKAGRFGSAMTAKVPLDDIVEGEHEYARQLGDGDYIVRVTEAGSSRSVGMLPFSVEGVGVGSAVRVEGTATPAAVQPDPSPGVGAMAGGDNLVGLLMTMLIQQGQQAQQAQASTMQTMTQMMGAIMNRQPPERTPVSEVAELMKLIEAGAGKGDDGGGELGDVLAKTLPAIAETMRQQPQAVPVTPAAAPPRVPKPPASPTPETKPNGPVSPDAHVATLIRSSRPDVAGFAENIAYIVVTVARQVRMGELSGVVAEQAAEIVIDTVGGDAVEQVVGQSDAEDVASLLLAGEPSLSPQYALEVAGVVVSAAGEVDDEADDEEEDDASGEGAAGE